ncbi:MAG TPA: cytochrome c [Gemmatimonadota bacterium]|jgi:cytochrome c
MASAARRRGRTRDAACRRTQVFTIVAAVALGVAVASACRDATRKAADREAGRRAGAAGNAPANDSAPGRDSAPAGIAGWATALEAESLPARFDVGKTASPEQIAALDIDARPDGRGLPPGQGTVARGAQVFQAKCARCHGPTGTEGPNDVLVGREPRQGFLFGQYTSLTRTIGNYWPYATTLYDFIHRAMPLDAPGSLAPDEVYSVVAFLLYRNEIVPEDAVIDATTLPAVRMPARDRFVPDNRRGGPEVR